MPQPPQPSALALPALGGGWHRQPHTKPSPQCRSPQSWGAGIGSRQMEGKQYSLCLYQFLHACVYV